MQWLQDPNRSHVYNSHNVRHEAGRHFRGGKKKEYVRAKIDKHESNSKIKNNRHMYRGINDFKKGY
jgi:hypothetical protein